MKKIFLLFVVAMFLAIGALQAQNATKSVVYLKNGTAIIGNIIEWRNDTITIKSSDGSVSSYSMNNVERIANVSALNDNTVENTQQEVVRYKIKRVGRDIKYVGSRGYLNMDALYQILDRDLYLRYKSAYGQAGMGTFFITTAIITGSLGTFWIVRGKTENVVKTGKVMCGVACVSLPTGCVVRIIGKSRIGRIVDEYNNERRAAEVFELSPSVLAFDDFTSGSESYALGATLTIKF